MFAHLDDGSDSDNSVAEEKTTTKTNTKNNRKPKGPAEVKREQPQHVDKPRHNTQSRDNHNAQSRDKYATGSKRVHDRHQSGNGRDKSINKAGGGSRNWGKPGEEAADSTLVVGDVVEEAEVYVPYVEEEEEEEEDLTVTVDEYAVTFAAKRTGEAFETKAAREVKSDFGAVQPAKTKHDRKTADDGHVGGTKRERDRNTKEKRKLEVGFAGHRQGGERGGDDRRGGRGGRGGARGGGRGGEGAPRGRGAPRGGRGGARGGGRGGARGGFRGGARGGFRGGRGGMAGLNIGDQSAFPSLG